MTLDSSIQQRIVDFVHRRIQYIRSGDRAHIEQTYSRFCLEGRNEYNRHDYDWYMHLIETGFGADVRRIDIASTAGRLPFEGIVSYPWPPQYRVLVTTVEDRQTLWLVAVEEDGPKIVLPRFNGKVADSIAIGQVLPWRESALAEVESDLTTVPTFHPDYFARCLGERIAHELDFWSGRWKFESIRALALDCAPWHGSIGLCLLTTREDFPEDEYGKWALGDWRLQDFTGSIGAEGWPAVQDLEQIMQQYYEGQAMTDADREPVERAQVIFRCCATALLSDKVAAALKHYDLSADFEIGVFDPDHPGTNYCDAV
jgi:hypothetical protein